MGFVFFYLEITFFGMHKMYIIVNTNTLDIKIYDDKIYITII